MYKKCCISFFFFFLQRDPLWFLHILLLPFPHTDNWTWQKAHYQKVLLLTKLPTSDSFRLGGGGGCGVCKSYCLCLSCFYAVIKLTGTYLYCWAKENSWFEAVKVFETDTHKYQPVSLEWCSELSRGTVTTLFPHHANPGIYGKWVWPVCWYVMSRGKRQKCILCVQT